jgi:acyl carrier protein
MPQDIEADFLSLIMKCGPKSVGQVTASSSLKNDLGYDSRAIVSLIVALEARYDISLEGQDLNLCNFNTVESCFHLVERYKHA